MGGVGYLVNRQADLLGELVAPGFQQCAIAIKNGHAGLRRARRDVYAILGIDNDAAAEAVFHPGRQLAPAFDPFVSMVAAANADRAFLLVGLGWNSSRG